MWECKHTTDPLECVIHGPNEAITCVAPPGTGTRVDGTSGVGTNAVGGALLAVLGVVEAVMT